VSDKFCLFPRLGKRVGLKSRKEVWNCCGEERKVVLELEPMGAAEVRETPTSILPSQARDLEIFPF
jgi:hypothetical protein